jgi:hypothetical protein
MMKDPIIHFAKRQDAGETVHAGPAQCGAGYAGRTENDQYVTGIFDDVTCKNCIRIVRAEVAREDRS